MMVTRRPLDSRIAAREAAAIPFPKEETTPPVTKTYLVICQLKKNRSTKYGQTRGKPNYTKSLCVS